VTESPLAVIVLAAGEGTRMVSRLPKVLHGFAGRSMLGHVLAAAAPLAAEHTVVVVGHARAEVTEHVAQIAPAARAVVQDRQLGTGHAVRVALDAVPAAASGTVLILPGDTPLLRPVTLADLLGAHDTARSAVSVLTSVVADPTGYGRVLRGTAGTDGTVRRIVEHRDATPEQLAVHEVAAGVYAVDHAFLREAVARLSSDNDQGELYLPDIVAIAVELGRSVTAEIASAELTAGVNDRVQLAAAARMYNDWVLERHMRAGVTVLDPATTWIDAGVVLAPDVTVLPATQLHGDTTVQSGAQIGPDVTLTDTAVGAGAHVTRAVAVEAQIGAGATVGPFAYLRPGAVLADGAHVGTYVEIKNSTIGPDSKVPHLSYVGDATIGTGTNVGAATVVVNYDGVAKHRTTIGDHARIGSDTMLVAPVTVGDGAYTAAGSVITQDVPPGAMGVARAAQRNLAGWVARRRAGTAADRAARAAVTTPADDNNDDADHAPKDSS
jgi:bifunctional UDP-N-acetylglucosamine pyrophosphorylase/glucosamine-1-phosphate N-acetyltransferase